MRFCNKSLQHSYKIGNFKACSCDTDISFNYYHLYQYKKMNKKMNPFTISFYKNKYNFFENHSSLHQIMTMITYK